MKSTACFLFLFAISPQAVAQQQIKGCVVDAVSGRPVEAATLQLFRGSAQLPIDYTLTDSDGLFALPLRKAEDSLAVSASRLGYKEKRLRVVAGGTLRFLLDEEVFRLKEVEIRPGRVYGRQDTINYDVGRFLSAADVSIKDVLRKLPGIDVDDDGRVSYNGREVSRFYVEGLDLSGGRYGQLSNNLQADAVKSVQVMENHQPIRVLQKKLTTDDVALNLTLKPDFRDRWLCNLEGSAGIGSHPLWQAAGNALQIGRGSQSAYLYKGNNTGEEIVGEQALLAASVQDEARRPSPSGFIPQPSFAAPLKEERLLFNQAHTLSANRLYKLSETTLLRLNANYAHDLARQTRGSRTSYYRTSDTLHIGQQSETHLRSDNANLSLNLESNADRRYLTNRLDLSGNWQQSLTHFVVPTPVRQQIETPLLGASNYLRGLWNKEKQTLEVRSLISYHHAPSRLRVEEEQQTMNFRRFYTEQSFSIFRKKGRLTRQYTAGVNGEANNLASGFLLYLTPRYQWTTGKWQATFELPLGWTHYPAAALSRLAANPRLAGYWKPNYAWRLSAFAHYQETVGEATSLYPSVYRTDYRSYIRNAALLPVEQRQLYSLYTEYKHTAGEFFATLSLTHLRSRSNLIYEQLFDAGQVILASHAMPTHSQGWTVGSRLSKGFFDWRLKTSLSLLLGRNTAQQLSQGQRLPYRSDFMQYEPKLVWSPLRHLEAAYQATIRYGWYHIGRTTHPAPLLDMVQSLRLSFHLFPFEIALAADHCLNDVTRDRTVNAFFADASIAWKTGSWQLGMSMRNLFNKRQYSYTRYSSAECYTSWIQIRPREFMLSAKHRF